MFFAIEFQRWASSEWYALDIVSSYLRADAIAMLAGASKKFSAVRVTPINLCGASSSNTAELRPAS